MINFVQPPVDQWEQPWHQLQADINQVIERMQWLPHDVAIATCRVHHNRPDEGGYWIRAGTPLTAKQMHVAGWRYLQPCDAYAPWVSWPHTEKVDFYQQSAIDLASLGSDIKDLPLRNGGQPLGMTPDQVSKTLKYLADIATMSEIVLEPDMHHHLTAIIENMANQMAAKAPANRTALVMDMIEALREEERRECAK